ncbi:hypothetical protein [Gloeobacter kilaueensis]|uniref:TonB C-terminal domain-containing protein n=1 Tax=Gloeobacter kilaueensis (strain ATCC BAA-2537 / CCAP 1431/1 / ULC 316 / JS1) TaxID=1183438 RepID=U5QKN2_GLOK1|nr:hypothetical protein [Gloeobacter kilaueensis]AGY59476.1 hypothetical protein GKIL_3230 [Gloeobacter kilaueensis JS1]
MNHLRPAVRPLLALSLVFALSPFAVRWMAVHTPEQTARALADAGWLELRDTFNPLKLVRWGQSALALPDALAALFRSEAETVPCEQSLSTFNLELSRQIRHYHDIYFNESGGNEYTVVAYDIDADGHVYNARLLPEYTTAPLDVAQRAVETVRDLDNNLPALPAGVRSVTVTELFWFGEPLGSTSSMVGYLSSLPDGRLITPVPYPSSSWTAQLSYSPDGRTLVETSDGVTRFWSPDTQQESR